VSAIYLDNRLVHYEVFGRGQPIIFLHSWVGSWRYWVSTMDMVAERYRAYALDFWGFGESEREQGEFTIESYRRMLLAFMDQIGLKQAHLVGHGLGGMVAIRAAHAYPDRFLRVVTVSTPLQGYVLREFIKPGTLSRLLGHNNPANIWSKLVSQIPIDDDEVQQELQEDTKNLQPAVLQGVQESMLTTDLLLELQELENTPLLAIYGEKDALVPSEHAEPHFQRNNRPHQQNIVLPRANHFPFLERSSTFGRLLLDFLVSEGSTPVEIKEQWRRRVSQREYL
jgi:pimeloyl-ACP methyl ester carboxylesterase